jgi:hypothetical protein
MVIAAVLALKQFSLVEFTVALKIVGCVSVMIWHEPSTVTETVLAQPVVPSEKVNVAVPPPTPETNPPFVMVATDVLLLFHVPPLEGVTVVVLPKQIVLLAMLTVGAGFTATVTSFEVVTEPQVGVDVHTINHVPVPKEAPVGVYVFPVAFVIGVIAPPDTERLPHWWVILPPPVSETVN